MRRKDPDRLATLADAALAVFTERGYRLTQVADIAAAAGVSAGSIYNYAEGKDALLKLAVLRAAGRLSEVTPPLAAPGLDGVVALIDAILTPVTLDWPVLTPAGRDPALPFRATLSAIVDETFAFLAARYRLIWLLDRLSLEMDAVRDIHVLGAKTRFLRQLTAFLALHIQDDEAAVAAVARGILEVIVWFAMHRHRDRLFPALGDEKALALARRLVLDGAAGGATTSR
ncbi:TetR/AcrR family transcriptional regulator [Pleomorphomonas diazotrophica]|uniref:TetR/AcrR family transcriptional regulator n=1 Tax=Pleomorphomonas diazotrophica TaxID=1166257 RepID=A0A1I4V4B3_9HYPH|nr:TetR family transcriptional regulator [Pleomorphomonas diazotrophica]PKR87435.1 TetR/AcrR family transcriptional regulator [Pleomorphomonas diazotrophica]SFM96022.1 DNA-binding transcriptional regulator, AcrR family [Pleomorphomonas diazotrophica]